MVLKKSIANLGLLFGLLCLVSLGNKASACTDGKDHDGILPKNNLKVSTSFFRAGETMTEETFNKIIDGVMKLYVPIVKEQGGNLIVQRLWKDETVNAYASQTGTAWQVSMFGGLARHPAITEDGFALVVCHEIGHHIGGYPKKKSMWGSSSWASNEGQSDYFGSSKCLKRYFKAQKNSQAVVAKKAVPEEVQNKCFAAWGQTPDHALCVRVALAGQSLGNLFAALGRSAKPDFAKPDTSVVAGMNDNHPASQCRLDTYFSGGLCTKSIDENMTNNSETAGACATSEGYKIGARPLCWFKPKTVKAGSKLVKKLAMK